MLENDLRTMLGFGDWNGFGCFKVQGWWGVIERSTLGNELRSELVEFVHIGGGEERLEEEEEEEEEERQQRSHDYWLRLPSCLLCYIRSLGNGNTLF